ncbi:hypothetical protein H5410_026771 [Solanum commersonii]|uniref:Uncharacterized protein n=1 Tax=Solanum commersonii TaxID=4109 RepID=A0A9J5Z009_SOLCO|nr:hypothetical protein H5410_026771 [Solanum commersonii]
MQQSTPILINNEVEEVVAVPEISETSTQEVAKTSPSVVPDISETSPRASAESSASILEETDTADQPLCRARRRPTWMMDFKASVCAKILGY